MKQVIGIVGPTAVGKSETADILASHLGSEVLSCDSMQVYRGMDIGTAKARPEECRAPLKLIDLVDPDVAYSAALYQRDARAEAERCLAAGRIPVFCGGTGLYLNAVIDCMEFPVGDVESPLRSELKRIEETEGPEALYRLLEERDPESAHVIHPNNTRRIIRALEMAEDGVSYAQQKANFSVPKPFYQPRLWCLTMERSRLYERINRRVDLMMQDGLLEEVQTLIEAGFKHSLTAMQAIGYKELIDYIDGLTSLDEAVELIKRRSRRYAKRQLIWFRREKRVKWINMDDLSPKAAAHQILEEL